MNTESSFAIGIGRTGKEPEVTLNPYYSRVSLSDGVLDTLDTSIVGVADTDEMKEWVIEQIKKLSKAPLYEHKCLSCGGTVELDYDKAIFICPYCGSHYAINTERINDRG